MVCGSFATWHWAKARTALICDGIWRPNRLPGRIPWTLLLQTIPDGRRTRKRARGRLLTAPPHLLRYCGSPDQGLLPAECATVLAFKQQEPVVVHTDTGDGAIVYVYGLGRIWRALIFATRPGRWRFGGIESEERLLTIDCSDVTAAKSLRQALERLWDRGPAGVQSESSETGSIL